MGSIQSYYNPKEEKINMECRRCSLVNKTETIKYRLKLDYEGKIGKRREYSDIFLQWLHAQWKSEFGEETSPSSVTLAAKWNFCLANSGDQFGGFLWEYIKVHHPVTSSEDDSKDKDKNRDSSSSNTGYNNWKNNLVNSEQEYYTKTPMFIDTGLSVIFQCQSVPHTCGSWQKARPITYNVCACLGNVPPSSCPVVDGKEEEWEEEDEDEGEDEEDEEKKKQKEEEMQIAQKKKEEENRIADEQWEQLKKEKDEERQVLLRLVSEYVGSRSSRCWREVNAGHGDGDTRAVYMASRPFLMHAKCAKSIYNGD